MYWQLIKQTSLEWWEDNTFRMAAAIAFYTIFSLAPVLIVAVAIGGLFLDDAEQSVRADLANELGALVGEAGGEAIEQVLDQASASASTPQALLISVLTILVGSTMVFIELQAALNEIWGVESKPRNSLLRQFLMARVRSFGIAMTVGLLLVISLVLSTTLQIFQNHLDRWLPAGAWLWNGLNLVVWILLVAVLFAMIYKFLPDVRIRWINVIIGAIVTSLLFSLGKYVIGLYLGHASYGSYYGAAGSFVVFLVWVYYSALICLYGAEFTHVYARLKRERVDTEEYAAPARDEKGREFEEEQGPGEGI